MQFLQFVSLKLPFFFDISAHCAGQKPMKRAAESSQSNHQYVNEGQPERKRFQQDEKCIK